QSSQLTSSSSPELSPLPRRSIWSTAKPAPASARALSAPALRERFISSAKGGRNSSAPRVVVALGRWSRQKRWPSSAASWNGIDSTDADPSAIELRADELNQASEGRERGSLDLIVLDDDAETFFQRREHAGDRHR